MSIAKELSNIFKIIVDAAASKQTMENIGESAKKSVVERTQSGYGVKQSGGTRSPLPDLKPSTISIRRAATLSAKTSPETSNLTRSGNLLENVDYVVKKEGSVQIKPTGRGNTKKARELDKIGFKFMNLDKTELDQIEEVIEKEIQKKINQIG